MDSSAIAVISAAIGSLIGASASIGTTWIAQRTQTDRANIEWRRRELESLYNELFTETSRLAVDAHIHSLEGVQQLATLYGLLNRIRVISSDEVLAKAEECCRRIVEIYWPPNNTLDEFR